MADLTSPATSNSNILAGTNRDTLYAVGWLNLSKEPVTLHVLDTGDRYYRVKFVDPRGDVFAYVGSTRTEAGDYLVSGPGWHGKLLDGVATRIASADNTVLVIRRGLVERNSDLPTARELGGQIRVTPFGQ
jgi:hypothetical protein